jgi:hypothetical protein
LTSGKGDQFVRLLGVLEDGDGDAVGAVQELRHAPSLHLREFPGGSAHQTCSALAGKITLGFLTGVLRLAVILAGGLLVLVSGAAVSLGEIAGQRFRSCLMFLSEPFVH